MSTTRIFSKTVEPTFKDPPILTAPVTMRKEPFKNEDRLGPCDPVDEKTFNVNTEFLLKINTEVNQSGFRTKTQDVFSSSNEDPKYVKDVNIKTSKQSTVEFKTETINESSNTFKYGTHALGTKNQTTDKNLILRGVQDNVPIKNKFGPHRNDAGVYSGYKGLEINNKNYV